MHKDEATYRSIFEAALDVLMLMDHQGNILDINRRAEVLTGYARSELLRMNVFEDLIIPADRPIIRHMLQNLVQGQDQEYEVHWQTKDARIIPFAGASTGRFSDNGEFLSTICALRDITERKQAEERLRRSEARFRALVENSSDGIILFSAEGIFRYVSPMNARIFNYNVEDLLGRNRFDFIHPDDLEQEKTNWARLLQQPDGIVTSEYRVRSKDGSWLWIERIFHNLLAEPRVEAIVGSYRVIAEHRETKGRHTTRPEIQPQIHEAVLFARAYETLTAREREVLQLTAAGRTANEIAAHLFISPRTVESHRTGFMRKLGLHNQTDLISYALKMGILPHF